MKRTHLGPALATLLFLGCVGEEPTEPRPLEERVSEREIDDALPSEVSLVVADPPPGVFRMVQPRPIDDGDSVIVAFSYTATPELMEVGRYSFSTGELECLSCGLTVEGEPHGSLDRPVPIAGERLVVQTRLGSESIGNEARFTFVVLECAPSLSRCDHPRLAPVEGLRQEGDLTVRYHVPSPDGSTLVWEALRPVGGLLHLSAVVMMMGDLQRTRTGEYRVVDPVVINPPFPDGRPDTAEALAIRGSYFEAKEFCDGGRTLFVNANVHRSCDIDNFMLDLSTGEMRRLTTSPGWDEGGHCSPNNTMLVQAVQREDVDAAGLSVLSRPPYLDSAQALGNLKNYYVVGEDGEPWPRRGGRRSVVLFPITGESSGRERRLSRGEAEGWFVGPGEAVFFRDNRRLVWTETRRGTLETRLVLATIETPLSLSPNRRDRTPPTPSWATPSGEYPNALSHPVSEIADGRGGTATITETFRRDRIVTRITYSDFHWLDSVLNGSEEVTLHLLEDPRGHLPFHANIQTDLRSSSSGLGHMEMNANIYEGCAENLEPFSCEVDGETFTTPWPESGSDCVGPSPIE